MMASENKAHARLLEEVTSALDVKDPSEGGLVCVFDGFFMYEQSDHGCHGVVAPKVDELSTFWIAASGPESEWEYIVREPAEVNSPVSVALVDGANAPARTMRNTPLADFEWMPPWTEYMEATPLARDWRWTNEWPLLLDMTLSAGAVAALPDRFTFRQQSTWQMHGQPHKQRTSTVGAYAVQGRGRIRIGQREFAYGGGPSRWTVVVVSHRQPFKSGEFGDAGRRRVGAAHDHALSEVHRAQLETLQRPEFGNVPDSRLTPARFEKSADEVVNGLHPDGEVAAAAGEVGCNSPRVRIGG